MERDLMLKLVGFSEVLAGLVLGFSVLMIVFAGFKYVTSQGDPKITEQAKMQIISAGVGIFIAMTAFIIVKIMAVGVGVDENTVVNETVQTPKDSNPFGIIMAVFGFIIFSVIGYSAYKSASKMTESSTDDKEDISEPMNESKELEVIFQPKVISISTIEEAIGNGEIEGTISDKFTNILSSMNILKGKLDEFDFETKHKVEESMENDLKRLFSTYKEINNNNKNDYENRVIESLSSMEKEIESIFVNIENRNILELEKALKIIEERYNDDEKFA